MGVTHTHRTVAALVIGLSCLGVASRSAAQEADVKGGRDHPLISRYAGASIVGFQDVNFGEFDLPLGPGSSGKLTKSERLQGKLSRVLYVAPAQRSTLEVFANYEQALAKAGFRTLFSCAAPACGGLSRVLYPVDRVLKQSGRNSEYAFSIPRDERYIAAMLTRPGSSNVYVSIYVATEKNSALERLSERAVILLDVIEPTTMETGRVTVNAEAMARDIAATGHVALYEIYFDFGSADLKPESDTALKEIALLLRKDPKLRLFVVGHTDNVGAFQTNLDLSKRRAASVVRALTTTQGIDASRLQAEGVGMLAPLAPNDTDAGRARNRRVELVRQ
jgi:OmpA-OmpF porin, OOP family